MARLAVYLRAASSVSVHNGCIKVCRMLFEFSPFMKVKHHILGLALMVLFSATAFGQSKAEHWLLAEVSSSDAAQIVIKKTGGKVLKVTEEERNGRGVYRVKVLLPEGRVKTVFVSKETGGIGG